MDFCWSKSLKLICKFLEADQISIILSNSIKKSRYILVIDQIFHDVRLDRCHSPWTYVLFITFYLFFFADVKLCSSFQFYLKTYWNEFSTVNFMRFCFVANQRQRNAFYPILNLYLLCDSISPFLSLSLVMLSARSKPLFVLTSIQWNYCTFNQLHWWWWWW